MTKIVAERGILSLSKRLIQTLFRKVMNRKPLPLAGMRNHPLIPSFAAIVFIVFRCILRVGNVALANAFASGS